MIMHGYAGIFGTPLMNLQPRSQHEVYTPRRSSIYCITNDMKQEIVMIPLVPNFFETAYMIGRHPSYNKIYLIMPGLDMVYISDAYQVWYELHKVLGKDVEIFTPDKPQLLVTDEFRSFVNYHEPGIQYQLCDWPADMDDFETVNVIIRYPSEYRPITRPASDIAISFGDMSLLFSMSMTEKKLNNYLIPGGHELFNEIHMPFVKNLYGGLNYMKTRRIAGSTIANKMVAYGFTSKDELQLISTVGGKVGKVIFDDLV